MEQSEILEGNKLIADFMKWQHHENVSYDNHEMSQLKYYLSWDWLMPVIEKISKMPIIGATEQSDTCYPRTFGMLQDDTGLPMFRFNCCCLYVGGTLIEAAWIAVVEFIKAEIQMSSQLVDEKCGKGQNIA